MAIFPVRCAAEVKGVEGETTKVIGGRASGWGVSPGEVANRLDPSGNVIAFVEKERVTHFAPLECKRLAGLSRGDGAGSEYQDDTRERTHRGFSESKS